MGRPKKDNARSTCVRVRCTEEELERIKKVAEWRGVSVSDYIREAIRNEEDSETIMEVVNHDINYY